MGEQLNDLFYSSEFSTRMRAQLTKDFNSNFPEAAGAIGAMQVSSLLAR